MGDAVAGECVAARIAEQASLEGARIDDAREGGAGFCPEGTDPFLVALAKKSDMTWRSQVEIGRRERERLADARTRVVQKQQQGVVALSQGSAPIRLGEDGSHLLRLEILDDASPGLLASKRENPLGIL